MNTKVYEEMRVLCGYTAADAELLAKHAAITKPWIPEFVTTFYDTVFDYEPTRKVFKDGERADREATTMQWFDQMLSGQHDEAFWQRQWVVGILHILRAVPNAFMLGMMSRVQQLFLDKVRAALPPDEALALYLAFKRATDVVAALIAESYFYTYVESMESVVGMNPTLVQRILHAEVGKRLQKERGG